MGWVSLFKPEDVKTLLHMPGGSHPIALLCLGPVETFYDQPMLERENWDTRRPLHSLIMEDRWHD